MRFLLDTNVISALAPSSPTRPQALADWLDRESDKLYLSVVTSMDIRSSIAKAHREGAVRKAANLKAWWETVEYLYAPRILPFDLKAAAIAGFMNDQARDSGHAPGFSDIVISAIAQVHELTVLTRNVWRFRPVYADVINPFETLPE